MTKGELYILEKRIDEILKIQELCDEDYDGDVLDNLDKELDEIIILLGGNPNEEPIEERRILSIAK